MVTFIPPYLGGEVKSNAERKMYDVLRGLQMEDACVLHSLGLPRHRDKVYGEIDFVVVCSRGVACLEIKGGRVECRDGVWVFTDRYGVERQKPEGPFAQVTGNMFSLLSELRGRFSGSPHMRNLLAACGVVFPDIAFRSQSQEVISEIVYDTRTTDITGYLNRIFDYWAGRQHREPSRLSPGDIREITAWLRGSFCFVPTLKDSLEFVEKRLVRLTREQSQIMDALSANPHLLIEGAAGTGKTLLAVDFARRRAADGDRVLYLTYNKNLANSITSQLDPAVRENLKVINIHALFGEYVPVDVEKIKSNPRQYFEEELPEAFYAWITGLPKEERTRLTYRQMIMDEGQDILSPGYLYSLDALLDGGLEKGRWAVFYDEKQNIYNPEYADGIDLIQSFACTKFRLFVNCRNTVQIGVYSARMSGVEIREFLQENGEEVQCIAHGDAADFARQVSDILNRLRAENIPLSDAVFLSPRKYANSLLGQSGIPVNELGDDYDADSRLPRYATIQGFKGLDAKIVILVDVDRISGRNFSRFLYIAGTRARTLLYVVASDAFWEKRKRNGDDRG